MRRYSLSAAAILLLSLALPRAVRADVFKLKDGSTIIGSVVGYEGNAFKVKTSYGYALVEKDKIVSIQLGGAPEATPEKKSTTDAAKTPAAEKAVPKASKGASAEEHAAAMKAEAPSSSAFAARAKSSDGAATPAGASGVNTAQSGSVMAAVNGSTSAQPTANTVAANAPSAPPEPQPIREKINGNTYINDTYEFEMYKPPDWQVMDGARSVLPGAVAAMGTDDQSTYLVVGQEAEGKSAAADIAATEKRLGDILVNFRPLSDEHLTISGSDVVAHRFRGSVDEHDWSGFMVFMPRGAKLYTIFGMTRADDDLVQIQENVIRRTIASFQFLPQ